MNSYKKHLKWAGIYSVLLVLLIISFLPQDEYIKDITINSLPDKIGVWHEDKNAFNNEYLLKPFYNADFFQVKTYQNKKNKDSLKLIFAYYKNIRKDAWLHTPEICVKNSGGKMVFKKYIKTSGYNALIGDSLYIIAWSLAFYLVNHYIKTYKVKIFIISLFFFNIVLQPFSHYSSRTGQTV